MTRITVNQYYTKAELKCHSSCSPAGRLSYVWFKNGKKMLGLKTSSYKGRVYARDIISCALEGHEESPSPSVCEFIPLFAGSTFICVVLCFTCDHSVRSCAPV